jgi:RNA polymerase sigma-70 factor (ECF subfamily)
MAQTRDFEGFYAENFRALTVQLYAYCGNFADAQEVVQEACCRALAHWPKLSQYDDPAGWVRRVAWNLATSQWRRTRRLSAWTLESTVDSAPGPTPDRIDLIAALAKLPEGQRKAVVLHYLADMSVDEIAAVSNVPSGTVKSWMSRARAALSADLSTAEPIQWAATRGRDMGSEAFVPATGIPARGSCVGVTVDDPLAELFHSWLAQLLHRR